MTRLNVVIAVMLAIAAQAGSAVSAKADPKDWTDQQKLAQELARRAFLRSQWPTGWQDINSNDQGKAGNCNNPPCGQTSQGAGKGTKLSTNGLLDGDRSFGVQGPAATGHPVGGRAIR